MSIKPTYATGVEATDYEPNQYAVWDSEQMEMIGKIAYTLIREVTASNPLSVFNKRPVDTGDTLEQVVIKLVESEGYDLSGANALTPDKRNKLAVQYFKNFTRKKFKTTVYPDQLRLMVGQISNKDEIATRLVSVLSESDIQENFEDIKGLLAFGSTAVSGKTPFVNGGTIAVKNGVVDYLGFLTKVKNIVKGMKFVNADYNTYGLKRRTRPEDIYIIAPYQLITETDVESLSAVFNLDKAEIRDRIIEIDTTTDTNGDYTVYIVDQNALQIVTQTYKMLDQENADGDFWNYFLHVNRLYAISTLFDGVFIKVATKAATNG